VPAALDKHLAGRDTALASLIPGPLAWTLTALPIALQRAGALVVCVRDPSEETRERLADVTGREIVLAVTPEIVLLPLIDEAYPARAASEPGVPIEIDVQIETGPIEKQDDPYLQLADLDDHRVEKDPEASSPRIRLPQQRITGAHAAVRAAARTLALDPALVALGAAADRAQIVDALLAFLRHRFQVGVVFAVQGGVALGEVGFADDVDDATVATLAIPLSERTALAIAHERASAYVGAPGALRLFGLAPARVCVAPIGREHLVYGHGVRKGTVEDAITELASVCSAAEDAFTRALYPRK